MYATSWLCMVIEITCYITNWLFLYLFQKHEELWYLWAPDIQTCGQQINFIHLHWPFPISKHFIRLALLRNHFIISKHFLIIFFLTSSNFIVVYAFFHFEHFSFLRSIFYFLKLLMWWMNMFGLIFSQRKSMIVHLFVWKTWELRHDFFSCWFLSWVLY